MYGANSTLRSSPQQNEATPVVHIQKQPFSSIHTQKSFPDFSPTLHISQAHHNIFILILTLSVFITTTSSSHISISLTYITPSQPPLSPPNPYHPLPTSITPLPTPITPSQPPLPLPNPYHPLPTSITPSQPLSPPPNLHYPLPTPITPSQPPLPSPNPHHPLPNHTFFFGGLGGFSEKGLSEVVCVVGARVALAFAVDAGVVANGEDGDLDAVWVPALQEAWSGS